MATNPLYYPKRDLAKYVCDAQLCGMQFSGEKYMQGFDYTSGIVNSFIGVANEVARIAIDDGRKALSRAGLYVRLVKKYGNETLNRQNAYEFLHNQNFGERKQMWLDYLDSVQEGYQDEIDGIASAVKDRFDAYGVKNSEAKARVECGRVCAIMACAQFDVIMERLKISIGFDYSSHFMRGRYTEPLFWWSRLADKVLTDNLPDLDLNVDEGCMKACDALSRKLNDKNHLNHLCENVMEMNKDIVEKYKDLGRQDFSLINTIL